MIVKFLRPATTFKGVGYSFAKMLLDKGELMLVKNFEALGGLSNPRPEDYVNYLEAVTRQSKRIVYPQLHVTISTKGRDHSKQELTDIAGKWMTGMGYGTHPYLIVFHKDTQNNHVHIVSTRIGRDGKKVKDSYEHLKGYQVLDEVIGLDKANQVQKDIEQALNYSFNSRAQFMMLLEVKGYTLILKDSHYQLIKFGQKQGDVSLSEVEKRIGEYQLNKKRLYQLKAIIEKYRTDYDPALFAEKSKLPGGGEGKVTGYNSKLAAMLQTDFGIQVIFHAKDGKQPYGYTILDHSQKAVYKGGELMPLAEFIKPSSPSDAVIKTKELTEQFEPPNLEGQAEPTRFSIDGPDNYLSSEASGEYHAPIIEYTAHGGYVPPLRIDISDDIDDEQINGRNRKRKRKARTNTR